MELTVNPRPSEFTQGGDSVGYTALYRWLHRFHRQQRRSCGENFEFKVSILAVSSNSLLEMLEVHARRMLGLEVAVAYVIGCVTRSSQGFFVPRSPILYLYL
jgi:hypothetical protein